PKKIIKTIKQPPPKSNKKSIQTKTQTKTTPLKTKITPQNHEGLFYFLLSKHQTKKVNHH
ncbi:MAG: hypothetical protein IJ338_00015, partial [Bacteroidaceae bacterium]|nr:hypothetical protein [Bacteroidaceae bacterium]